MQWNDDSKIRVETIVKIITYLTGLTGFVSVYRHISPFYSLSFLFIYLLSIYLDYKKTSFISRWALNALSVVVIVISFFQLNLDDPVPTMLEGLLILLAIKFLEAKKFRDYMQIYAITVFLLAGSALMTIDIIFLVYFLILTFMLTVAIVLLTYYTHDPALELGKGVVYKIVLKSLFIPLISIPLTSLMFVILPRTNFPLLNYLNREGKAMTGFTDNVRLGDVSSIQEDASIIFRANMERIDDDFLYWRGVVMDYFNGGSWRAIEKTNMGKSSYIRGKIIKQTIYLEPYGNKYLPALDKPLSVSLKDVKIYKDFTVSLSDNIEGRLKYDVFSFLSETINEADIDRDRYLQLPEGISPDITALVKSLSSGKNNREAIEVFLNFFLRGDRFKYSIKNLPVSEKPVEDFIFRYRYGNCEYFASAMAVMLRAAGIPARVVGGYKGGYYNEVGRYYMVPQKNAHLWVEAYPEDGYWIRLDPTPASIADFTLSSGRGFLFKSILFFDSINFYWNALVINYDLKKQILLLTRLRSAVRNPKINLSIEKTDIINLAAVMSAGLLVVFLSYLLFFKRKKTFEEKIIERFMKEAERNGYKKGKSEGLEEFASRIQDTDLKERAQRFAVEFEKVYYKDKTLTKAELSSLKEIIKRGREVTGRGERI